MPASTPNVRPSRPVEIVIRVLAPPLDLSLAVGERVARILAPANPDCVPPRMAREGEFAPGGLRGR
jgi:hypothetical protein